MTTGMQRMLCQTGLEMRQYCELPLRGDPARNIFCTKREGNYIKCNAALYHARRHHCGVGVLYTRITLPSLTKPSTHHITTLPYVKDPLRGRARAWYVGYGIKVFSSREVSQHERMNPPFGTQ
jgi:hypothetical protein